MVLSKRFLIWNFFCWILLGIGVAGCQRANVYQDSADMLLDNQGPDFSKMISFTRMLNSEFGSSSFESARIEYLLERISDSPYEFVRNGTAHDSRKAVSHMRWKYAKYRDEVRNADDFVEKIAGGSRKTGEPYLMRINHKDFFYCQSVLKNELRILDNAYQQKKQEKALTNKT